MGYEDPTMDVCEVERECVVVTSTGIEGDIDTGWDDDINIGF